MDKCPICESPSNIEYRNHEADLIVSCYRCGKYKIEDDVIKFEIDGDKLSPQQIANISSWIRENQGSDLILTSERIKSLITLKNLSVAEKADKILKYLAKQYPVAGSEIDHAYDKIVSLIRLKMLINDKSLNNASIYLPLLSSGRIINSNEYHFIWKEYLIKTKKYISSEQPRIITPAGWAYLESLRQANPDSKKAFVAMWFTDEMKEICESYIKKLLKKQVVIKQHQLMKKIIMEI